MDVVRLVALRAEPLSVDEVVAAVADTSSGGTALFVGTVRDTDSGKPVESLAYSAHPSATEQMRRLAEKVAVEADVRALAVVHRVGELELGDIAVIVAVACPHRGEAFTAARRLIDELKATVPIWKHQRFAGGGDEWVGLP